MLAEAAAMTTPLVQIRNVSHRFGDLDGARDVSLDIAAGELHGAARAVGVGQDDAAFHSRRLLVAPSEGRVLIAGSDCTDLPPAQRPTTTVFQDYALFPHMTVGANVGFGLRMRGVGETERAAARDEALELVGLDGMIDRKPHQLSGGQRQRVALARALVVESVGAPARRAAGRARPEAAPPDAGRAQGHPARVGTAFVHVTHDQEEAMALADH